MKKEYDVIVIGGGPAGLAAAISAKKAGATPLIIERNDRLGGILLQCIHNGFGSVIFKKDFPGPQYAQKFADEAISLGIDYLTDTMVTDLTPNKKVYATSSVNGYLELQAKSVVLAMGCRERTRAQIRLAGTRPAGVFTAGMVQRLVNIEGFMPGREFVILGSGDIGLIMARRLTMEGAKVKCVLELLPHLSGLHRNYVQCLEDFDIPLYTSTTVKRIVGKNRVTAVETQKVDKNLRPVPNSEEFISCDTLLLSVGLIPENELSKRAGVEIDPITGGPKVDENMATNVAGIFSAGNVVTIYDLVDYVSMAGKRAGKSAADFALGKAKSSAAKIRVVSGENVRSLIPQTLNFDRLGGEEVHFEFRVSKPMEHAVVADVLSGNRVLKTFKKRYARPAEMMTLKMKGRDILDSMMSPSDEITVRVIDAD